MDDIVRQAMQKWPHVPDCYGWLGLGERGQWLMRDDAAQAAGPFAGAHSSAASRGSVLQHQGLVAFIGRNYAVDARGCWYFQNGPQRVFVELQAAPWVLRVGTQAAAFAVQTHTGLDVDVRSAWCDEQGRLYLHTAAGLGLVHSQDMVHAAAALDAQRWLLHEMPAADMPAHFGFVPSPQALVATVSVQANP